MNVFNAKPVVNLIILNWNGGTVVLNAISSALNLNPPVSDIIVVDNASTDGSDVEIERRFSNVTLIRNERNLGFAAGNNVGIQYALENGADYVFLLNNDARLESSTLTVMISALQANPHRGIIVPKIYFDTENGKTSPRRIWAAGAEWRAFPPRVTMRGYREIDIGQYNTPGVVEYATACALLIHRRTFEIVGLLDESYFMYQEDYAFCDRVRANNMVLWYEPRSVVYHLVSSSTGEGSAQKWQYWAPGIVLFYVQHYGSMRKAAIPLLIFLLWVTGREFFKSNGNLTWVKPLGEGLQAGLVRYIED
jgi:GT2 family glycosyltransferase